MIGQSTGKGGVFSPSRQQGPNAHRIKHSRYPTPRHFRIMRQHRGSFWPMHAGARFQMPFQIIGMKLNQTRRNKPSAQILGHGHGRS